jgi:hydrophobe/amphiphile efflux-1 (HAE1) family protein
MNLSAFFIKRPIFAAVISIIIFLGGLIAAFQLPISEYPDVVPPTVVVTAQFPGANPKTIADVVATPLEEEINGTENMLYMFSQAASDGTLTLTVSFKLGTDPNLAQQLVQNRVNQALPRLPEVTQRIGVKTAKVSPQVTLAVHLKSASNRYNMLYMRNYAAINIRDQLSRLPGVGNVVMWGSGDYAMRIWLDPEKIAERGLSADEVIAAVRSHNVQASAGVIGGPPYKLGNELQIPVSVDGRLQTPEQFENVVIRSDEKGVVTYLKDVARVELDSAEYGLRSLLNNRDAFAMVIFSLPGANEVDVSNKVRGAMKDLSKHFPEGLEYHVVYDPTVFVRDSIKAVFHTLLEALVMVVLVVIVFLQTWRASIIPLLAVPVSIVGTFAIMALTGGSINSLSLFGLVLAIGIVVDDAIVVVENVERNIRNGLSPRDATLKAMTEVTSPIIGITLVLCSVFIPIAFVSGLTGQFYKQFALTIAFSTVISAFNSLTLSPALASMLLVAHDAKKDFFTRGIDFVFGRFFNRFNHIFEGASRKYSGLLGSVIRRKVLMLGVYALFLVGTFYIFKKAPPGFVPTQDKAYLVSFVQLPEGANLARTEEVIREAGAIEMKDPGVQDAVQFPGLSINGFINSPSSGIAFMALKPFEARKAANLSGPAIAARLQAQFNNIKGAYVAVFPPPPVSGLGTIGGFKLQVEDRGDLGYEALDETMKKVIAQAHKTPELRGVFTSYQVNTPQLFADVNRTKVEQLEVNLQDVFDAMQIYLGSYYINDFNRFGRTYQVIAQADKEFRSKEADLLQLKVKNKKGKMVPLGSMVQLRRTAGPESAMHYNAYRSADLSGGPAPGYSIGQAQNAVARILNQTLPKGMTFEWTDLTYQQILAGNTTLYVFPICILLVYLVLAAKYESLFLPLPVIFIIPLSLFSAMCGVSLTRGDVNIFTQIALFVLAGLTCKNAILIVEFARELETHGSNTMVAAIEGARLRLRPVLMTSFAFIMGVMPLTFAVGAGAEMRRAMGVAVFAGMLGVTLFGLVLTPVFYVVLRAIEKVVARREVPKNSKPAECCPQELRTALV